MIERGFSASAKTQQATLIKPSHTAELRQIAE
jgi:hypothetical protein